MMKLQKSKQTVFPRFLHNNQNVLQKKIVVDPNQFFKWHESILIDEHESIYQLIHIVVYESGEIDVELHFTVCGTYEPQIVVTMCGSNSRAQIRLFFKIYKTGSLTLISKQIHEASHSVTDLLCKAVVADVGKMNHRGIVHIPQNIVSCEAFETTKIILLGDQAEAYAEPQLEIENNEVVCVHGSAIGRFDDEQIFYLACRGISVSRREQLLIDAFFKN